MHSMFAKCVKDRKIDVEKTHHFNTYACCSLALLPKQCSEHSLSVSLMSLINRITTILLHLIIIAIKNIITPTVTINITELLSLWETTNFPHVG